MFVIYEAVWRVGVGLELEMGAKMEGGSDRVERGWTGKLKMTTLLSETPAELETPRVE